jgi:hypothetical protein
MSLEQSTDPCPQNRPPRRAGWLALTTSFGAGTLTWLTTHDATLSVEVATYILAAAESLRGEQ